jgi:conjugative transposon protein TcpC
MARRALARNSAVYEEDTVAGSTLEGPTALDPSHYPAEDFGRSSGEKRRGRRSGGGWRGSGGRWWIWVGRAVLWALILVILVNGVRAPFERFTAQENRTPTTPRASQGAQFPRDAVAAYALQFGNVYLNYNQQAAGERERQLQAFVPDGSGQFGWNTVGSLSVQSVQVASVEVRDANNAMVTLLARSDDRWFQLAVPVYAKDNAMVISGRPALLAPPARAVPPGPDVGERDSGLENDLQTTLGSFFDAYAKDAQVLSQLTDGPITGLNGTVEYVRLVEVVAPTGAADKRTVTATVTWRIPPRAPGAELDQSYELTMVRKDGKWFVSDINGATRSAGS